MKTTKSEEYTDPILYKEGFFKNEESEQNFLKSLRSRVETAINTKKTSGKAIEITPYKMNSRAYNATPKIRAKQSAKTASH